MSFVWSALYQLRWLHEYLNILNYNLTDELAILSSPALLAVAAIVRSTADIIHAYAAIFAIHSTVAV